MSRQFAIITLSVVPVRAEPADSAEQVTQILFGESIEVLEKLPKWWKIQCLWDEYVGWIDPKQCTVIEANELLNPHELTIDRISMLTAGVGLQPISIGSNLPSFEENNFTINQQQYSFTGQTNSTKYFNQSNISTLAKLFLFTPYQWGGRSIFGIDCSGFTQVVYKVIGFAIPRDAKDQALHGETINFVDELTAGDLVFFDNEEGKIIHVGIALGDGQIIHASGQVRIDQLDHQGIFNLETQAYTHKLRLMKRLFQKT